MGMPQQGCKLPKNGNEKFREEDFQYTTSNFGVTRRYRYPDGKVFSEFVSHSKLFGIPLIHRTHGRHPQTGRLVVARGVIAIGRIAFGALAIGQFALGLLAIGQASIAVCFGLGQVSAGLTAVGQLAIGGILGMGQLAVGALSIGQIAIGWVAIGQFALARHGIDVRGVDPELLAWVQRIGGSLPF